MVNTTVVQCNFGDVFFFKITILFIFRNSIFIPIRVFVDCYDYMYSYYPATTYLSYLPNSSKQGDIPTLMVHYLTAILFIYLGNCFVLK